MDKIITLHLKSNEDIEVMVDEIELITIEAENRIINAKKIYDILDYKKGMNIVFDIIEDGKDKKVVEKLKELLEDIVKELKEISILDDDEDFENKVKECIEE
jgi:hypothetical protein